MCERHVGRKSTNNLNLTCQWGSCRTTTVKRDHITSHIRVHVPLKPHKCDFCGKAFKRPQDLKKHVKTHADDSVLVRSPEPSARNPDMMFPGHAKGSLGPLFPAQLDSRVLAHVGPIDHHYPSLETDNCPYYPGYAPTAHYFEPALNPVPTQSYHAPPQYYHSHAPQPPNPSYGNVYYTLNQGHDPGNVTYESKKRGYDALNDFFGDLKRRQFDTNSYAAIGQRLLNLQNLQLPILSGGPVPEYQPMPAPVAVGAGGGGGYGGPQPVQYQLPPMGNVRTKSDLLNIDQFLEQMQNTIYESDDHVAASGVAQPGAHYVQGGMNYRTTNSPPSQLPPSHATAAPTSAAPILNTATTAHSPPTGTPALTPPSSAQSYTSGRSPISLPPTHHETTSSSSMYPRLPSTMSDSMTAGYPTASSAAPPSTLSGVFDHDDRRRYTGGTLQRARPDDSRQMSVTMEDISPPPSSGKGDSDGDRTPPAKEHPSSSGTAMGQEISASLIDPALHSKDSSPSEADASTLRTAQAATEVAERADSQWVSLVRALEGLRGWINYRIDHEDYDDGERPAEPEQKQEQEFPEQESQEKAQEPEQEQPVKQPSPHEDAQMEGVESGPEGRPEASPENEQKSPVKDEGDGTDTVMYPSLRGLDEDGDSRMPS